MKRLFMISFVLCAMVFVTACSADSGAPQSENPVAEKEVVEAVKPGERIALEGAANTRDLGGYQTTDGMMVKPHLLIRSGALDKLTENDGRILTEEYGLKTIVDLRTDTEVAQKPDLVMEGVTVVRNPLIRDATVGMTHEGSTEKEGSAVDMLIEMVEQMDGKVEEYNRGSYAKLVTDDYSLSQLKNFFTILLENEDGAILWHCTAGKDRVGTSTALLLSALGVDREVIVEDFLLTNTFYKAQEDALIKVASEKTTDPEMLENIRILNGVRESYIRTVFTTIDEQYGSMDQFLEEQMGLTPEKRQLLKDKYLVKL